jgi:hypothetical protein
LAKDEPEARRRNPRINQELNCLKQILEQAGLWQTLKPFYKQLPMPKWKPPRVMTPEKEDEVLRDRGVEQELGSCALLPGDH